MSDTPSILSVSVDHLHPWVATHYPFISHLFKISPHFAAELCIKSVGSFTSLPLLYALLSQGFYPRNIIGKCYDSFLSQKGPIDDYIHEMRCYRILFSCSDLDNGRRIFSSKTQWHYIPALCQKVISSPGLEPPPVNKEWFEIQFDLCSLPTMDPLPWLISLLYEFSSPANILTSPTLCRSHIKQTEVYVEVHRSVLRGGVRVFFNDSQLERCRAALKTTCIRDVLDEHPTFQVLVSNVVISSKDRSVDVDILSDEAVKFLEDRQRQWALKRFNSNRCGSSQNMSGIKNPSASNDSRLIQ